MKTTKLFCLIIIIMLFSIKLSAQEDGSFNKIHYGINIGASLNNFNSFEIDHAKFGINLGAYVEYTIVDWVKISTELNYQQLGSSDIDPMLIYSENSAALINLIETYINIHNFDLPILMKLSIPNYAGMIKPHLLLGYVFGYNIKSWASNLRLDSNDDGL